MQLWTRALDWIRDNPWKVGAVVLANLALIGSLVVFSGNLLQSDPPPYPGKRQVAAELAQAKTQVEQELGRALQTQSQHNRQEDRSNDATAATFCSIFMSAEGQARAAVQRKPSDATAQTELLTNHRLRQKWCQQATGGVN